MSRAVEVVVQPGDAHVGPALRSEPRIRVLLVGPSLDILGGQAVQLQRLASRLSSVSTIKVDFCPVNPRLPGRLDLLRRVKFVRTIATSIAYVISLLRMVRRADVVHAFSASYWSFLLAPLPAMLIGRLFGKAVILNYHSGEAEDHLRRWRLIAVPAMRLAHVIVVPSAYLVQVFARYDLTAEAIFNFVDETRIPFRRRDRPRPVFLSNRNLEPLYNVGCIMLAFARIQREIPESRLIVAGFGSERASLERLARDLRLQSVEFRGRLSPERMEQLYDEADVFLNSSDIDNMPLSLIEAAVAGLPIATTAAGGIPFMVTHEQTALLVERGDDSGLADAALRILREEGLATRLTAAGRAECLAKYVWPAVGPEWERLYHDAHRRCASPRNTRRFQSA